MRDREYTKDTNNVLYTRQRVDAKDANNILNRSREREIQKAMSDSRNYSDAAGRGYDGDPMSPYHNNIYDNSAYQNDIYLNNIYRNDAYSNMQYKDQVRKMAPHRMHGENEEEPSEMSAFGAIFIIGVFIVVGLLFLLS